MLRKGFTVNQYIIKEDDNEFTQIGAEGSVHWYLKGRWGIAKPKRNYKKFVMVMVSAEGGLANVRFGH